MKIRDDDDLGAIRLRDANGESYEEICTAVQHVGRVRVLVWTRIPAGMTRQDLGRRFFRPAVEVSHG
jgi:hypothetical protein